MKTLNEIASSSGALLTEMVKIDAEGLDLRVLAGVGDLLGKTGIFLVEVAVCAPLENSIAEGIKFMTATGYRFFDIPDLNRSPKHEVLWLCELAFIGNHSQLFDGIETYE